MARAVQRILLTGVPTRALAKDSDSSIGLLRAVDRMALQVKEFSLQSGALPPTAQVIGFRGTEALTRPYVIDIYVAAPAGVDIDPKAVVGLPATLVVHPLSDLASSGLELPVSWGGIIARFQVVRATAMSTLYRATLVPKLWTLGQTKHSRVWTKMSIADILKAVLAQEGVTNFEFRAAGGAPEEFVCQYRESSLDFIHRWMEREGLYYFFKQTGSGETLVVVDSPAMHEPNAYGPVRYHPNPDDHIAARHFDTFITGASSLPAMVRLTDYDYNNPSVPVTGMSPVGGKAGEVADPASDARVFNSGDGARIAKVRAEALRAKGQEGRATGSALGLSPGYKFALEQHPHPMLDKEYLVTRHDIVGRLPESVRSWRIHELEGSDQVVSVEIAAISADLQYREPRRTPWPRVEGYENGVIDGPADSQYAQIDPMGRYLVKMKFDEGPLTAGQASCFVRMMQPHVGAPEGMHFPLRKGTEVIFLFLGGDPDRPVIAGAIPDATHPSVVTASNMTKNVLQTGARNRFELEDQAGSEWVKLSTQGDQTHLFMGKPGEGGDHSFALETQKDGEIHTGTNLDVKVDGKWDVKVQGTLTEDVQSDVDEKYHASVTQTVDSNKTVKVSGSFKETIGGGSTQDISGGLNQTISGGETRSVSGGLTESISGDETRDVSSSFTESVDASWTQTVNAAWTQTTNASATHTINGSLTQSIQGGATITTPAAYKITATGGITIDCEAGMKVMAPGGVQFQAPGGFTVIAPGGIRTVDSVLDNQGNTFDTMFGVNITAAILKQEFTGESKSIGLFAKIDFMLANFKVGIAQFSTIEQKTKYGGVKVCAEGFGIAINAISSRA